MVIDDSEDVRSLIATYLVELPGYEACGYYTNAKEAISAFKENRPDIIVSNILIFGMTGYQLAELLKTSVPKISVILMSEDKKHALQSREKGIIGFLEKPINQEKFNKLILKIH